MQLHHRGVPPKGQEILNESSCTSGSVLSAHNGHLIYLVILYSSFIVGRKSAFPTTIAMPHKKIRRSKNYPIDSLVSVKGNSER